MPPALSLAATLSRKEIVAPTYPRKAIDAALELLRGAGYDVPDRLKIPIGIGVHTGAAFVGTIQGAEGTVTDMATIGASAVPNLTPRRRITSVPV